MDNKRPRTPLSPCPDTADDDINIDDLDVEDAVSENELIKAGLDNNDQKQSEGDNFHSIEGNAFYNLLSNNKEYKDRHSDKIELEDQYFGQKKIDEKRVSSKERKPKVRSRKSSPKVYSIEKSRRSFVKTDPRLLINRRNRLLRLREAARRRIGGSLPTQKLSSINLPQRRRVPYRHDGSSYDSIRYNNNNNNNSRRLPARRNNFEMNDYFLRRNPSYYPQRRSPSPANRGNRREPVQFISSSYNRRYDSTRIPPRPQYDISYSRNKSLRDEPFSYSSSRNYRSFPMRDFRSINSFKLSSSRFSDRNRISYYPIFEPSTSSSALASSSHHNGPVYEGGVLISSSSVRQEFTMSPSPVRSFNKFNAHPLQRYNNRQPTFERRNRSNLPRIKNWRCPKRELSPGD